MGIICTIIYEIAVYIMQYIVIGINLEILQFIKTLLIEVIYNIIIIIILYITSINNVLINCNISKFIPITIYCII